jgi:hypothetical protein
MAALVTQNIARTGLNPSYVAADASNTLTAKLNQLTFLHVKNGSGGTVQVTMIDNGGVFDPEIGAVATADLGTQVSAGSEKMIAISPAVIGPGGVVNFTVSPTTSVTLAAIDLPSVTN